MNNSCSQRVTGNRVNLGFLVNAVAGFARMRACRGRGVVDLTILPIDFNLERSNRIENSRETNLETENSIL